MGNSLLSYVPFEVTCRRRSSHAKRGTGYVDGCFDLMHSGHFNAIRQAKGLCDRLVVGIHSDAVIAANKGPPVMKEFERYELLKHVKWIDEIAYDTPYAPTEKLLDSLGADFVVHGDDMPAASAGSSRGAYDDLKDVGRLRVIKRTEGVSTTDFIGRLLSLSTEHHRKDDVLFGRKRSASDGSTSNSPRGDNLPPSPKASDYSKNVASTARNLLSNQGIKLLTSTRRINEFSQPHRSPTAEDKVVYIDGGFDMFHIGHARTLQKAKELGTFLIAGIYDDETVNQIKGANYPIATLYERVLCVCACKWVDEVIIAAPLKVTEDMISSLGIKVVAVGSHTVKNYFREPGYSTDYAKNMSSYYEVPERLGIIKEVDSDYTELTTAVIAQRVAENRLAYIKRNDNREKKETDYYKEKVESATTSLLNGEGAK